MRTADRLDPDRTAAQATGLERGLNNADQKVNRLASPTGIHRYPGGKRNLIKHIIPRLRERYRPGSQYREPFFGAGAVGLEMVSAVPDLKEVWFNDRDPATAGTWWAAVKQTEELKQRLRDRLPDVFFFDFLQRRLLAINSLDDLVVYNPAALAFMKIYVHQTSFSGLGPRSGGPLGGRDQTGRYTIDCRYNVESICKNLDRAARLIAGVGHHPAVCSCLDFEEVLREPGSAFFYLDPPYFKAGPALYQTYFSRDDHVRLSRLLRAEDRPWILYYYNHSSIRELYEGWASIEPIEAKYSISGPAKVSELLITNRR